MRVVESRQSRGAARRDRLGGSQPEARKAIMGRKLLTKETRWERLFKGPISSSLRGVGDITAVE